MREILFGGIPSLLLLVGCSSPGVGTPQSLPPQVMAQLSSHAVGAAALGFSIEGAGPAAVLRGPRPGYHAPGNIVTFPFSCEDGWPVVMARLNGGVTAPFIFDTGASHTTLEGRAAARAGVRTVRTNDFPVRNVHGIGGMERLGLGLLDSFALGALGITNMPVQVRLEETKAGSRRHRENSLLGLVPGIAGFSYVTIDYGLSMITVAPREEFRPSGSGTRAALRLPFVIRDGSLRVMLGLPNGHDAEFLVDTGMGGEICLSMATIDNASLGNTVNRGRQVALMGIGGVTMEKQFTLDWLDVAGHRYAYLRASTCSWTPFNLIGSGWLRQFRVTFDFRHQLLWLE